MVKSTSPLAVILTIASAASMALEIAAGRMIAPYVGMSLYTWTAVIAVVLSGLAVGHWIGGALAGRHGALFTVLVAAAISAFASQFLLRAVSASALETLSPMGAVIAITGLAFFLPSLFAGTVGPLATFLALNSAPDAARGRVLGLMYALGAIGAIAGVILGGLVLIPYLGSARTIAVIAVAYALAASLASVGPSRIVALTTAILVAGTTLAFGAAWTPCDRESGYFCIQVDDLSPTSRVLALDHLVHGINDRDEPQRLHSPYVALIDEIAQRRFVEGPRRAFFIGGGAYTLPRAWGSRWPDTTIIVSEIDPMVTETARERMWVDTAMTIRHKDARALLAEEAGPFDVIVGDAFADISIPPHLVTDEFHALVAEKLSSDGVYVMNVVDLLRHPRFATSLAETLLNRFNSVELWLDESAISPEEGRTTWILVASKTPITADRIGAADGTGRSWVRVPLDRMLDVVGGRVFLTDDHAPVARLLDGLLLKSRYSE